MFWSDRVLENAQEFHLELVDPLAFEDRPPHTLEPRTDFAERKELSRVLGPKKRGRKQQSC